MKTPHAELHSALDELVLRAQKPSRYVGLEFGVVRKDLAAAAVRFALAFPDTYEVGMSNLGFRLLYHALNERDGVACERVFLPWPDMEALLKAEGRGVVGAFSPSGLSLDGPAHEYHRALMAQLASGEHARLGDAILAAQRTYAETGLMPELLDVYQLLGDPATRIR